MKCRKIGQPIEAHLWSADNPHPDQFSTVGGNPYIKTLGRDHYHFLKEGDVILITGLVGVYEVLTPAQFAAGFEWVE